MCHMSHVICQVSAFFWRVFTLFLRVPSENIDEGAPISGDPPTCTLMYRSDKSEKNVEHYGCHADSSRCPAWDPGALCLLRQVQLISRLSFISPGKKGTNALFDVLQFVTTFTHVSRYPGACNRKPKKIRRKKCYDYVVLDLWKKWLKLSVNILWKKIINIFLTLRGWNWAVTHFVTPFTQVFRHFRV